jgi:hypothetical protein
MDESASTETGAIVLELLLKAGVIVVEDNGKYRRGDTDKFVILHGDVKTMDNINLLQETIRKSMNGSGYSELSNQLLVFDQAYVREDLQCTDQWRVMTAVFLLISSDFLAFLTAYRESDSIMIEQSYQRFAPIWRVVGEV